MIYWHGYIKEIIPRDASMKTKKLSCTFLLITRGRWQMASVGAVLLLFLSSAVWAFPSYEGCQECHGGFEVNPYTSLHDDTNWGIDLMQGHWPFVERNCNACHKAGGRDEVFLNFSADATLSKGCVGCHGRDEDVTGNCAGGGGVQEQCGSGAGLRQHHELQVGAGTCSGCHDGDATPVGEHIAPFNYGMSSIVMRDSCDGDGSESQYGATGLDNDGDGQRDGDDPDCQENSLPTQPGMLSASAVTDSSATVQWGASSDDDGDPISYQVDYRRNGETPWSDGGSTGNSSQPLSGLDADQSYDVRVTPNDGTGDGPSRSATNLFQTEAGGPTFTMDAGLNGNWWNGLDRNGEGVQVEVSDGGNGSLTFVATIYSYDDMGNQIFLIAVGTVNGDTVEVDVFITEGGLWGDDYDPSLVVESEWGSGTFTASSCEAMHMSLMPNAQFQGMGYTDLMYDLMRLTTPAAPCPAEVSN
jgi:predicted CXXCH cytochrome family protein